MIEKLAYRHLCTPLLRNTVLHMLQIMAEFR
jgi:hypothetical protein